MCRIFIPTIMHTGTHFCRNGLFGIFPRANPGIDPDAICEHEHVVINVHVTTEELERIKLELRDYDVMRIFNPTIMHTGTQFCRHILFSEFRRGSIGMLKKKHGHNIIIGAHVTSPQIERMDSELQQPDRIIVVPLRHPARVLQSFLKRGKTHVMFIEQWNNMINVIDPYNPFYIHLDLPDRREEVDVIERVLGFKLPVSENDEEWPIFNSRAGTHDIPLDEFPVNNIPDRFIEFYERTRKCKPI